MVVLHVDEFGDDFVVGVVEWSGLFRLQIAAFHGELKPHLCFSGFASTVGEFVNEGGWVFSFVPAFGDIGRDRS